MADDQPAVDDPALAALSSISDALAHKGWLTTEWWTTVIGGGASAALAFVGVGGSTATQIVSVVAPALLAAIYAMVRTRHKSAMAAVLQGAFPQALAGSAGPPPSVGTNAAAGAAEVAATEAVAQTDPEFAFEGIPPIDSPQANPPVAEVEE